VLKTSVPGEVIAPIVYKLEQAAAGEDRDAVLVALLAMALVVMYPEIGPEQLQYAVDEITNYMCIILDPSVEDPNANPVLN